MVSTYGFSNRPISNLSLNILTTALSMSDIETSPSSKAEIRFLLYALPPRSASTPAFKDKAAACFTDFAAR
jgi:hypothetical protein